MLCELSTFGGETPAAEREMTDVSAVAEKIERPNQTLDATDLVGAIRARREAIDQQSEVGDADGLLPGQAEIPTETIAKSEMVPKKRWQASQQVTNTACRIGITSNQRSKQQSNQRQKNRICSAAAARAEEPEPAPASLVAATAAPVRPEGTYDLPSVELLERAEKRRASEHDAEIREISEAIETVFNEFRVSVKVVGARRGPVITQYELALEDAGMRVQKVEGFEKDLCLRLGTQGIRIVAPLPNRKTVGVEVPNRIQESVVMRDLVEELDSEEYKLPLILGRDVLGQAMVGDLAKMPHLLVAGATGMGKSVCLNAIISSILLFRSPQQVKFIMVDPKMVELAPYDGIPHLLCRRSPICHWHMLLWNGPVN